ncbi:hypothetical protein T02_13619 [Trichinella nativa]|uniref:Uncharacterized protein n=1 Tax=Trichinella nativa TaxID=6335 RepID=A0A0V1L7E8_9BILA|nr:hypothetical protein T02_13619 [Trichinella nativa]
MLLSLRDGVGVSVLSSVEIKIAQPRMKHDDLMRTHFTVIHQSGRGDKWPSFITTIPSVTTGRCAMMEEENKRSAPAVPSSKLEHVKLLEDECARCFGLD